MRGLAVACILVLISGAPSGAAEADLQVSACTADALERAVGEWLQPLAGGDLEPVRSPTVVPWSGPARLRVRVQDSALRRTVVPVEVQIQGQGGSRLLFMSWRRNGSTPTQAVQAQRDQPVTLVSRVGTVEVESPGRLLSALPGGKARVLNTRTRRIVTGAWLDAGRVLVEGKASP